MWSSSASTAAVLSPRRSRKIPRRNDGSAASRAGNSPPTAGPGFPWRHRRPRAAWPGPPEARVQPKPRAKPFGPTRRQRRFAGPDPPAPAGAWDRAWSNRGWRAIWRQVGGKSRREGWGNRAPARPGPRPRRRWRGPCRRRAVTGRPGPPGCEKPAAAAPPPGPGHRENDSAGTPSHPPAPPAPTPGHWPPDPRSR